MSCGQRGLDNHHWRQRLHCSGPALALSRGHGCHGARAAASVSGSSRPEAGSGLPLSFLLSVRGVKVGSYGVYVHHVDEAGTPRMIKSSFAGAPNVVVVL
jgi:hypothetical protein